MVGTGTPQGPREKALLRLAPRHRAFVQAYLRHYNATRAVREVYGCSYNAAKVQGSRLMARADVRRAVALGAVTGELIARYAAADTVSRTAKVIHSRKAKPSDMIKGARMIFEIAGLIQPKRRR